MPLDVKNGVKPELAEKIHFCVLGDPSAYATAGLDPASASAAEL